MPQDSVPFSTSGHIMHGQAQESMIKALQCGQCALIFKSKVYLFEHLFKVHGFDVDSSLGKAGLIHQSIEANPDNSGSSSENVFSCQNCDFQSSHQDILIEHEKQCQKRYDNLNGTINNSENPETETTTTLMDIKDAGPEEVPPSFTVMSTSITKCTPNSSKDIKTYNRQLQTITKYFKSSSGSDGKPDGKLPLNGIKETLVLQESPSTSSGVYKVTAKSMIDLTKKVSRQVLLSDHPLIIDRTFLKPNEKSKESVTITVGSRTSIENSEGPPAKKAKSCKGEPKPTWNKKTSKEETPRSASFSFEVSEDDEEKDVLKRDTENSKIFFCKHCDYINVNIRDMSVHYKNDHPCVICNAAYIQDPQDHSAAFRCLECPVQYASVPDLKQHYMEKHPEAPDVFSVQSCELNLIFKCFVCRFTTTLLKALKDHYATMHQTYKVDNPLFYCRYSATRRQSASPQLNTCTAGQHEMAHRAEELQESPPEGAQSSCKEVRSASSPQDSTPTGADVGIYHCNSCNFSHKSAVVLHVHYQKNHPAEPVTIDKIKLTYTKSMMTPEESPNEANSTPQKDITETSTNANDKAKNSYQNISLPLVDLKQETETCHSETTKPEKIESAEDGREMNTPLSNHEGESSAGVDDSSKQFYCRFCSYSSNKIRSVLGHCNAKHTLYGRTSIEELVHYSAEVQKKKLQSKANPSANAASSHVQTEQDDSHSHEQHLCEENEVVDASAMAFRSYNYPETLFYCEKCNFGNPSLRGVLNHQSQIHRRIHSSKEYILRHTAVIHKEIKKSKSDKKQSPSDSDLPLPIINEGDENVFFCHFCNYRHRSLNDVLKHYFKRHPEVKGKTEQIRRYTSLVLEKTQKYPLKAENIESTYPTLGSKKNIQKTKKHDKSFSVSALPSVTSSETQRILQCYRCSYNTQYVYLLRKHMWKAHRTNRSCHDVLRSCFNQGNIQSGYHCHLCVFSHENAATVYNHYQDQHPGHKLTCEYISSHLYAGPKKSLPKKKKTKKKRTNGVSDGSDETMPSQGLNEANMYSCKACSFKGSSRSSISQHYRAVHPWSVKEDGSVLGVVINRKRHANSQLKDTNEIPESFETYQIPLEFDQPMDSSNEQDESPKTFKCSHCPASFSTGHSLSTHSGMKHKNAVNEKVSEQQDPQTQTRVHVFKCPHCPYINNNYQGVLTHCQMKHPALVPRAISLHVEKSHFQSLADSLKTNSSGDHLRYRGYMCKICLQIYATPEKLNTHCKSDHEKGALTPNLPKPAPKSPVVSIIKLNPNSNAHNTRGSSSKPYFLSKKTNAIVRCQFCSYSCHTKIGLSRHILFHHRNLSTETVKEVYKCRLCTRSYFWKKRLGSHYAKKHGRAAFLKYYAPEHKRLPQTPPSHPLNRQPESTSEALKSSATTKKTKILVFKCPSCPYVNASYHGILTHCQMIHRDLVARADELQTDEILVTNMINCPLGKGSNERGYLCNRCPQIHPSIIKLKKHSRREHPQAELTAAVHSDKSETEGQPSYGSVGPALEPASLRSRMKAAIKIDPSQDVGSTRPVPNKEPLYKCHICAYKGSCRKYLYCHYRYTHKLDTLSMFKQLEKYNKRRAPKLTQAESEDTKPVSCKKCLNLTFTSSQLLIAHYSAFHRPECKPDFIVLTQRTNRSTGIYRCTHCKKQINGIKNLSCHLDRHRAYRKMKNAKASEKQAATVSSATPETRSSERSRQDKLESVDELAQRNVTPVQTLVLPTSPLSSPSNPTDLEQCELESREGKHSCTQCRRSFMSLKGLRSHERSHAALAAIKNLDNLPPSALKHNMNKYLIYKSGTIRPFLCSICSFRTTVQGLWKSHLMKKHLDYIMDTETDNKDEERAKADILHSVDEMKSSPKPDEEPELTEKSLYLEPPDVQRQLTQYNLMAQIGVSAQENLQETVLPDNSLLHCEFCNFSTGHQSSMRRHYLNRHGRKILRCKDCDFFTGIRKTLEKHMETGHSSFQSQATHQKDLRCPFCLYQTKNKNNMIDHIVLHREERVVPIEVRRPKLSRYLQGIVFRCHKCTFTSSSADNLRLHMTRHNDLRPYKCRLCYFDCTHLSGLEAHLSDKHQVLRNHELVGQVSLKQLEATVDMMQVQKEEQAPGLEEHNGDYGDGGTEVLVADCSEYLHDILQIDKLTENDLQDKTLQHVRKTEQKHAEELKEQAGIGLLSDTANLDGMQNSGKDWNVETQTEKPSDNQAQDIPKDEKLVSLCNFTQFKRSQRDSLVISFASCKSELHSHEDGEKVEHSHKEMPILEENKLLTRGNKEEDTASLELEQARKDAMILEDDQIRCKDHGQEKRTRIKEASTRGAAALPLHPSVTEKKLYTCELCGRNFVNNNDLARHIVRHGM